MSVLNHFPTKRFEVEADRLADVYFSIRHHINRMMPVVLGSVFALLVIFQTTVVAAKPVPATMEIVKVSVGFDGRYKTGAWTPVRVTVQNVPRDLPAELVFTAQDDEGIPCQFENSGVEVSDVEVSDVGGASQATSRRERTFEGYVCFGRRPADLQVTVTVDGETATTRWQPASDDYILSTQQWVLMIGARPIDNPRQKSLSVAARLLDRPRGQEVRVLQLADVAQLPRQWFGLDAFDLIVICGSQPEAWERITHQQRQSIDEWTRLGGQLMLAVGDEADKLLSVESPLEQWVPGTFAERVIVPTTTQLEQFAGATDRLDVILQSGDWSNRWQTLAGQFGLPMALIREPHGRVVFSESFEDETMPVLMRNVRGLGHLVFVAFDVDSEPLQQWSGYNKLMMRLLQMTVDQRDGEQLESGGGRVAHLGFDDISGQLRTALEQFAGVRLVPFALIGLFAVCYVLLIGPLEFLGLSKLSNKMHWTWFTFPVTALAICGLALVLSNRWKGTQPKVNQVDLVDWDTESSVVRGHHWAHFYSPTARAFDCKLHFHDPLRRLTTHAETILSWHGLPGSSFGGMDASPPFQPYKQPYSIRLPQSPTSSNMTSSAAASSITGLALPVASSRAVHAGWWSFSPPSVGCDLKQQVDTYLIGTIENPLNVDLRDAALLYDRWYYKLGVVNANSTVTIDRSMSATSLKSELIGRVVQKDTHAIAPWQQTSFDVHRIMEMVMFQRAAGGRNYTGLVHRQHGELDFTEQLASGRAVLIGRIRSPVTRLSTIEFPNDSEQKWTCFRLLLPVVPYQSDTL